MGPKTQSLSERNEMDILFLQPVHTHISIFNPCRLEPFVDLYAVFSCFNPCSSFLQVVPKYSIELSAAGTQNVDCQCGRLYVFKPHLITKGGKINDVYGFKLARLECGAS
jgi:hypothetical protein